MIFVWTEEFLSYREPGHPESPERVSAIVSFLRRKRAGRFVEATPCAEEDLLRAHSPELVRMVRENSFFDPDTPNSPAAYRCAALSCGAGIAAAELCLEGEPAFSLGRPPGHHAGRRTLGGFCYFNTMAVAVKRLRAAGKKVAVLDIDGHHGNGTEEILRGDEGVVYASVHQFPAFPGTGTASFGNCHNFPVPPFCRRQQYRSAFDEAVEVVREFRPDVVGVSAGFDGHSADPLLRLPLIERDYYEMGKEIGKIPAALFFVLEGGYNPRVVGSSCYCLVHGISRKRKGG